MNQKNKQSILSNFSLRTKMLGLVSAVVLISVVPLSLIVLYRNQTVVLEKTFEVCRNLAQNISNLSTEELLINETFDATRTSIVRLKQGNISGLLNSFVVNIDGKLIAELNENRIGQNVPSQILKYYQSLNELTLEEVNVENRILLRFIYPIFINYNNETMRVGTAVFDFDKDKVYEPVYQIRNTVLIVSTFLFILGIIIAVLAAFSLTKSLQKLTEGAKLIGSGDLNVRIPLTGKDEIGNLAETFNQMTSKISDFTNNLESMVEKRTDELNETLKEVQALKESQDGDYFLTSLLLDPLQLNNNSNSNVKTEFLIEQKKKFKFRKWNSEIGGDLCITDTIRLRDRDYTVFVNGDAMGKSIQGAGGALVFSVVLNASIMRAKLDKNNSIHPEFWIQERYLDIHNVFLSFEGSMYISTSFGLIDNLNGMMYYFNAEHPFTVLYRDGKASFLEEEFVLRKIGTPAQESKFRINLFQLHQHDVIFLGSDGRDDILVNIYGDEVMNQDELLFLKSIEQGNGQLKNIYSNTLKNGKLADDLSLLKISYKEDSNFESIENLPELNKKFNEIKKIILTDKKEALVLIKQIEKEKDKFPEVYKILGDIYKLQENIDLALESYLNYIEKMPIDNEAIYSISCFYKTIGNLNEAIIYGEKLHLRNPNHYNNNKNLLTLYNSTGNLEKLSHLKEKLSNFKETQNIKNQSVKKYE